MIKRIIKRNILKKLRKIYLKKHKISMGRMRKDFYESNIKPTLNNFKKFLLIQIVTSEKEKAVDTKVKG